MIKEIPFIHSFTISYLGISVVNKEQLAGTEASVSCIITGLTKKLDNVKWTTSDDAAISSGQSGFTIVDGEFDNTAGGSQTTILTISGAQNNGDTTYNCLITSAEHVETEKMTVVKLKTFSKFTS